MLVKRYWKLNSEWKRQKTEIIPFDACLKHLKYYFTNIENIKKLLEKGQIIKTPYFNLEKGKNNGNRRYRDRLN